jgi:hypothetical protein
MAECELSSSSLVDLAGLRYEMKRTDGSVVARRVKGRISTTSKLVKRAKGEVSSRYAQAAATNGLLLVLATVQCRCTRFVAAGFGAYFWPVTPTEVCTFGRS